MTGTFVESSCMRAVQVVIAFLIYVYLANDTLLVSHGSSSASLTELL